MRLLIILFMAGTLNTNTAQGNSKDKYRKKDNYKAHSTNNPCETESYKSPISCHCSPSSHLGNASKIDCCIFTKDLTRDYYIWDSFSSQPYTEELKIVVRSGGVFSFIPTQTLEHLKNLKSLDVMYASIEQIDSYTFTNLTRLQELKLTRNQIVNLHHHAFTYLPRLLELNLDENRISELKREVFVNLPSLQKMYITQNNISVLQDEIFKDLTHLLELDLCCNYINVITRNTFTGLGELKRLYLNNNSISMLGDLTFAELRNLEELVLESNQIAFIWNRAFVGLTHLILLNLGYNHLTTLSSNLLSGVPMISYLDFRFNNLETFKFESIKPVFRNFYKEGSHLHIADNKFICDCRLAWMYSLKNETKSKQIRDVLDELMCYMENHAETNTLTMTTVGFEVYEDEYFLIGQRDAAFKPLLSIAAGDLPCLHKESSERTGNYFNTPAYAEINSGCVRPVLYLFLLGFKFLLFWT